jgi:hypothetical protein
LDRGKERKSKRKEERYIQTKNIILTRKRNPDRLNRRSQYTITSPKLYGNKMRTSQNPIRITLSLELTTEVMSH